MSQSTRWEQPGALLLYLVVTRWLTVEFWDKLPNPKPGCLACKEWKNPIENRGVTSH